MAKVQIEANEIHDPSVNLVSIVKRGANRIPFRITKEDPSEMIDISQIGRTMFAKSANVGPTAVAVIIAKSDAERMTRIEKCLTDAGLDLSKLEKKDDVGQVSFAKADLDKVDAKETFILKMSDEIAVVIQGDTELVKSISTYDWESTSFSEIMTKGSFMPSVCVAQDMLSRTFYNIFEKAETPSDLASLTKTAIGDFQNYMVTLCKGLPTAVFKADLALRKEEIASSPVYGNDAVADARNKNLGAQVSNDIEGDPAAGNPKGKTGPKATEVEGTVDNDIEGSPAAGNAKGAGSVVKEGEKEPEGTKVEKKEGGEKKDAKTEEKDEKKEVKKAEPDPVLAAIEAMNKALTSSIDAVRTDVEAKFGAVTKTVDGLKGELSKMDEAVNGTVGATAQADKTGLTKNETGNDNRVPPLLDTAYSRVDEEEEYRERRARQRA